MIEDNFCGYGEKYNVSGNKISQLKSLWLDSRDVYVKLIIGIRSCLRVLPLALREIENDDIYSPYRSKVLLSLLMIYTAVGKSQKNVNQLCALAGNLADSAHRGASNDSSRRYAAAISSLAAFDIKSALDMAATTNAPLGAEWVWRELSADCRLFEIGGVDLKSLRRQPLWTTPEAGPHGPFLATWEGVIAGTVHSDYWTIWYRSLLESQSGRVILLGTLPEIKKWSKLVDTKKYFLL